MTRTQTGGASCLFSRYFIPVLSAILGRYDIARATKRKEIYKDLSRKAQKKLRCVFSPVAYSRTAYSAAAFFVIFVLSLRNPQQRRGRPCSVAHVSQFVFPYRCYRGHFHLIVCDGAQMKRIVCEVAPTSRYHQRQPVLSFSLRVLF